MKVINYQQYQGILQFVIQEHACVRTQNQLRKKSHKEMNSLNTTYALELAPHETYVVLYKYLCIIATLLE